MLAFFKAAICIIPLFSKGVVVVYLLQHSFENVLNGNTSYICNRSLMYERKTIPYPVVILVDLCRCLSCIYASMP